MLCIHPVTNETNGDKCPKCLCEEEGTNHPLYIYKGFVSCRFVSLSFG
jgi:hypothetical protein